MLKVLPNTPKYKTNFNGLTTNIKNPKVFRTALLKDLYETFSVPQKLQGDLNGPNHIFNFDTQQKELPAGKYNIDDLVKITVINMQPLKEFFETHPKIDLDIQLNDNKLKMVMTDKDKKIKNTRENIGVRAFLFQAKEFTDNLIETSNKILDMNT